MNTNLLAIINRIVAEQGEGILSEPRRVSAFFADLAKDEPKPQKNAFIKCLEQGFVQTLKNAPEQDRVLCKQRLSQRLNEEEGLDPRLCGEALELLAAVLFGEEKKKKENICKNCGQVIIEGAQFCIKCGTAVNTSSVPNTTPQVKVFGGVAAKQMKHEPAPRRRSPLKPFIIAGSILIVIAIVLLSIFAFNGKDEKLYVSGDDRTVLSGEDEKLNAPSKIDEKLVFSSEFDVYACGHTGDKVGYWKNEKFVDLSKIYDYGKTTAESIYVSGNDVYVCGKVDDKPVYWKNGELVELPLNRSDGGDAESIYVSGNDLYVVGTAIGPVYWKNGKLVELPSVYFGRNYSIYVSGNDVYISGPVSKKTSYWKNGEIIELPTKEHGGGTSTIYVSSNDVYVCGAVVTDYINFYNSSNKAVYWKNGKLVELPSIDNKISNAQSIYVSGNDVYVGGNINLDPVYWKNGELVTLPNGIVYYNAESVYVSAFSVDSFYISDNDVYACGSGSNCVVIWKNSNIVRFFSMKNEETYMNSVFLKKK
jgi:hypothetical protein